jgi:hypothetical protein
MKLNLIIFFSLSLILLPMAVIAGEVVFAPRISLIAEYDDNIDFNRKSDNAVDDFSGRARPEARFEYSTELFNLNARGYLDFQKYLDETDFDRTNHFYRINSRYQAHPRWNLSGNYRFRRDESIDSQFEETGRSFRRKRLQRHDALGRVRYKLTELSDIGPLLSYRRLHYSGRGNTDYDLYRIALPYTKKFQNQRDSIRLTPAYSRYESDFNQEADGYRLTFGWNRLISENLTLDMYAGPRYTKTQEADGDENSNWGAVGGIGLWKQGETFTGNIRLWHDLDSTSDGRIINVSRLRMTTDKRMSERFGIRFSGWAIYTNRENDDLPSDKVFSFILIPALYYMLTENHFLELRYNYRNQRELDEPGNPVTQRNVVNLRLVLDFPKVWN